MDYRGFFIEKFPQGEGFNIAINQDHPALQVEIMKISQTRFYSFPFPLKTQIFSTSFLSAPFFCQIQTSRDMPFLERLI